MPSDPPKTGGTGPPIVHPRKIGIEAVIDDAVRAALAARGNGGNGNGGGGMDDMLRRLGNVEASVSLIKAEVSGLTTGMAHVATKADIESLKTTISASESSILKYFIGTIIAILVAFLAVAKFYKG